ncbi:hypothetical protein WA026_018179 [Henosepilachna vigintioctopunctata]|uniref:Large ribosomal subunit protein mL46 n=1 Tax=Henosepilachna vigintioctopunctata TaxID=420089 RepID=A0AAW1UPT9_9CUCU
MISYKSKYILKSFINIHNRVNLSAAAENSVEKWDLITAVCLERKPVIAPEPSKMEKEFQDYLSDLELRNSLKNDFELRNESEIKKIELLKSGEVDLDSDVTLKQTAQDFIDASTEEAMSFKLAGRTTANENNNRSLNRKLDKHLVLLVKQKIGNVHHYLLPQGPRQEGETLRQAAERILKTNCGNEIKAQIYGNAPAGFYKYKYPKSLRTEGCTGAKVFIYFARYLQGHLPNKDVDYLWLDRQELAKTLPKEYGQSINQFLVDE